MISIRTVNDIFFQIASSTETVMQTRDAEGKWHSIRGTELLRRVANLAHTLLAWGIHKGDRIALLAENRWEWATTDFAALAIGAIDVPIYPTLTSDQVRVLLADSAARVAVVSTRKQYEKVAAIRHLTALEHIIIMDDETVEGAVRFSSLMSTVADISHTHELTECAGQVHPGDVATLIYTSGTTGEPKGVILTHANMAANLNHSSTDFEINRNDLCISFLPLSHITARHLDYVLLGRGAVLAYCPSFDLLPVVMKEVRPTILVAVPRVYEKIRQEVERQASLSPLKQKLVAKALSIGLANMEPVLEGKRPSSLSWKLFHQLVYSKVHKAFGGRVRLFVSGGAPLGVETAKWFASVGIRILEGYGLTETSPVIAINSPLSSRLGAVGKLLPNLEAKIAEDGELLVRGPSVFPGYWQKPEETAASFSEGGWFHTGDICHFDEDRFLYVTDRKKELLKTSGGKLIAPQPIENKLKGHFLVGQAALVGDRHKFASVLISPNFKALEEWAVQQNIPRMPRPQLISHPRVVAEYQRIVDQANVGLANFETIKRLRLVPDEWSIETGELTPSLKLKRRVINARYAEAIAAFYADEAVAHA